VEFSIGVAVFDIKTLQRQSYAAMSVSAREANMAFR